MAYQQDVATGRLDTIPPHVPSDRVVDFDYFNPPGVVDDPHGAWKRLHDGPDIVFTPLNGGHWIATRAADIFAVMHDTATFSSAEFTVPKRSPGNPPMIPLALDPPEHGPIRSIVLRPLSPNAVAPFEPAIRRIMATRIAELAPRGRCEFMAAFASDIPPELFLEYARVPKDKLRVMKAFADAVAGSGDEDARREGRIGGHDYMRTLMADRAGSDGDDVFSIIARAQEEGRIDAESAISLALNVFLGGLETVSSALSFVALFLARNPDHRRQLIDDPSLCGDAAEELMRRFGILNLARIATTRTVIGGMTIEAGEQVLLPLHLAGLDERKFPDPMTVDFHRTRAAHYNFGTGPHRCVGSNLARPELRIFIEEWMKAIPDFAVDPADRPIGRSAIAMTMTRVPLVWPTC